MNSFETNVDIASDNTVAALREEVQSLRTLFVGALLVLIILSGSLNIFLMRQASIASNQAGESQKNLDEFNTVSVPMARELWGRLNEFSKTHPDVNPIITKYAPFFQVPVTNAPVPVP